MGSHLLAGSRGGGREGGLVGRERGERQWGRNIEGKGSGRKERCGMRNKTEHRRRKEGREEKMFLERGAYL